MRFARFAACNSVWRVGAAVLLLVACADEPSPPGGPREVRGLDGAPSDVMQSAGAGGASAPSAGSAAGAPVRTEPAVAPDPAGMITGGAAGAAGASPDMPVEPLPACALGTAVDCADCGDPACLLPNTLLACTSADQCARAVCAVGFGNCSTSTPDCEVSFEPGGGCLPSYLGTTAFPTDYPYAASTAIGTDGSFFLSGAFRGTVDFDPGAAQDVHSAAGPADLAAFITKLNADGSYAWTRSFSELGVALGPVAAAAGGAVVAAGVFSSSIDLDPGPGVDQHQVGSVPFIGPLAMVLKLAADGSFVWGRSFEGVVERAGNTVTGVAVDATDAVYVAGTVNATVDVDPGPGTTLASGPFSGAALLVKLTSAGEFAWARSIDAGDCKTSFGGLALATDGAVWAVGTSGGSAACGSDALIAPPAQPLIAAYSSAGDERGVWRLQARANAFGLGVAAGANGSVYIAGAGSGLIDADLGPGVALRWTGDASLNIASNSFLLKLAPDASLLWAQALPGLRLAALAAADDGGVLLAGEGDTALVLELGPDGAPAWTFALGGTNGFASSVAARGNSFAVAGGNSEAGDFDPGPGTQLLDGVIRFLSRFEL